MERWRTIRKHTRAPEDTLILGGQPLATATKALEDTFIRGGQLLDKNSTVCIEHLQKLGLMRKKGGYPFARPGLNQLHYTKITASATFDLLISGPLGSLILLL